MKAVITADIHAHDFNQFSYITESGRSNRLEAILSAISSMREHCLSVGASTFIIAGDIYESQDKISIDVLDGVSSELYKFHKDGIEVILILGNHDYAIRSAKYHSLRPFESFARIIDKPEHISLGEDGDGTGLDIFCIPFTENRLKLVNSLNVMKRKVNDVSGYKLLLAHVGLSDALIGVSERRIKSPINSSKLRPDKYDLCLLGHYHKPQQVADNVYYIGSPLQTNWDEREDEKVFFEVDSEDGSYSVIEVDGPKFRLLTPKEFDELDEVSKKRDFIKIQPDDKKEADKLKDQELGRNVRVLTPEDPEEVEEDKEESSLSISTSNSMKDNIAPYVKSFDFEEDESNQLINLGQEIIDSVS